MAKIRTFVAVECPKNIRSRASSIIGNLAANAPGIRWVEQENLHVTVKFLGDVHDSEIYSVCRSVSNAAANHESFSMICQGVGAFPKADRPRTVWLGIEDPENSLENVFLSLEQGLADLGFPREPKRFHPHLTIGRLQRGAHDVGDLADRIATNEKVEIGVIPVTELVIFSSELTAEGPIYTPMGRAPLA